MTGAAWIQEDVLTIPGAESGFGASVALDGDTVLIGLPLQDGGPVDAGRALVFVRDGAGSWSLQQELFSAAPAAGDHFGAAVALDGDRAVVGSPDEGGAVGGAAYVFERSGTAWSQVERLVAPDGAFSFGSSVSVSGNTVVVSGLPIAERVFAFVEDGGTWSSEGQVGSGLTAPAQIIVDGDRIAVAATFEVLVFERSGGVWGEAVHLPGNANRIALDGDILVAGTDPCPGGSGARVWVNESGTWVDGGALALEGDVNPVAISGQRVVVGATGGGACPGQLAASFDVTFVTAASATFRNAGTNPASYSVVPASYGQSLELTVDLTTTGHDMALVVGFDSPFGVTLGGGQTLLCFDLLGSGGELFNTGFHPGPVAEILLPVPNDPAFEGFSLCTQAVHAFGAAPFALSNAQDLVIGGCP